VHIFEVVGHVALKAREIFQVATIVNELVLVAGEHAVLVALGPDRHRLAAAAATGPHRLMEAVIARPLECLSEVQNVFPVGLALVFEVVAGSPDAVGPRLGMIRLHGPGAGDVGLPAAITKPDAGHADRHPIGLAVGAIREVKATGLIVEAMIGDFRHLCWLIPYSGLTPASSQTRV